MSASVSLVPAVADGDGPAVDPVGAPPRRRAVPDLWWPTVVTALNAVAFFLVRPDVNDLWAARARAAAVEDGVGLTYWFSWFSGGATPGTYSVVTPYLSSLVGPELVCALSAVAVTVVGTIAVRGTRHPVVASWTVALVVLANLWSGRVPFLLGGAIGIGAIIALQHRNRPLTVVLTLLSMFASPVSGAFIAVGLCGTFITTRTREWRPIIAWAVGTVGVALVAVAIVFGTPGPEGFGTLFALQVLVCLVLLYLARPTDHIRTTIMWSALAVVVVFAIPNGMGSNFSRFVVFCLPVVVLAVTERRLRTALLLVAPVLATGLAGTVNDLANATRPVSSVAYYQPLAKELDRLPDLTTYRVEVVNHGAHAGYDALLGHAMLARGWETQQDMALNQSLRTDPLDPTTYKVWLDNNAVGYVALPSTTVAHYPEYDLVASGRATYLREIWRTDDWQLFRVQNAVPIVAPPAHIVAATQSALTVHVPCACRTFVRVHWSKFLEATLQVPRTVNGTRTSTEVSAVIADDGHGWTTMTTTRPGAYVLAGSLSGIAR
ncbi:hypothetical protein [Jatrophihabitans fulvus]